MRNDTLKLTDKKVLQLARRGMKAHLPLRAQGYKCRTDDLLNVLLSVAATQGTLERACRDLTGVAHPATLRRYLNSQLCVKELPQLEAAMNALLTTQIPLRLLQQAQEVALDFHDEPYYGKQPQAEGLWVRGRRRSGTSRFYRLATAYVMRGHLRLTLAIHFVLPGESTFAVLKHLLRRLRALPVEVAVLCLDKAFAGVTEMRFLSKLGVPSIMACSIRGKQGGTRALCQGRKSYRTQHTFRRRDGQHFTTPVAVCRVFTTAQRTGRMPRKATWVLFIVLHLPHWTPQRLRHTYRRRFGIESSYRCAGQVRGWTTAANPAYRFTLLALAFYLVNLWLHLRWLFTQVARRGGRWLDEKRLRLARFAKFVVRALEDHYGYTHEIVALHAPIT